MTEARPFADTSAKSLLLVDSNADERRVVSSVASRSGWSVVGAADLETALGLLEGPHGREVRCAILSSWRGEESSKIVEALCEAREGLPIIVLADDGSIPLAVDAMRAGASDFLGKPVAPERLLDALNTHADRRRPKGELAPLSEKLAPEMSLEQLVGSTPEFRSASAVAAKAARNRLPLIITGESGTGKETVARAIHAASLRAKGPIVIVNCHAISAKAIDSELFGHVAGAFPGAFNEKIGRIVEANEGTLVLKEIGALPPETQAALDRVLATGEVRPVGCNGSSSVDVRLIATNSRQLEDHFHKGLAERVNHTRVHLPPLRERSSDIPALARHFLGRISEEPGMRSLSIGNDALQVLMRYGWPGNLRQLSGALFRAAVHSDGNSLTSDDFPHIAIQSRFTGRHSDKVEGLSKASSDQAMAGSGPVTIFDSEGHIRTLGDIEADLIRLAIGHYRGRMTEVAKRLGIGRSTLYRKLGDLGIDTSSAA